jgi:galactose mutarotase-like enzyme
MVDTGRADPPTGEPIAFVEGTRGGWDECLPSIASCADPNPGRDGELVGDHGDFWAQPWRVEHASATEVLLDSDGIDHPLRVRKTIRLWSGRPGFEVRLHVHNRSEDDYRFLYSAHPLWAWEHPAEIELPGATEVRSAFGEDWPPSTVASWPSVPVVAGGRRDLSDIPRSGKPANYKVFVRWAGEARLSFPALRAAVVLRQSPDVTPWLGLCVNRDAWPAIGAGESWIAVEPTTAPTDSLLTALELGAARLLAPGASLSWTSSIELVDTTTGAHNA